MKRTECPVCEKKLVLPNGPKDADVFLAGEFPGWKEVVKGMPFVGDTGDILRRELERVRIDYKACRAGNLWLHEVRKSCNIQWHVDQFNEELAHHKYVLLMGSEFGGIYYDGGSFDFNGRLIELPGGALGIITINPAMIPKDCVGEFRFGLERFAHLVKEGRKGLGRAYKHTAVKSGD